MRTEHKPRTTIWFPAETKNYWGLKIDDPEKLQEYYGMLEKLSGEANAISGSLVASFAEFFSIPIAYVTGNLPEIYVYDAVAGGQTQHHPDTNRISIASKYFMAYFLGEAADLHQTEYYPTLAHELGHFLLLAMICKGDVREFFDAYIYKLDKVADEFFARLCQRLGAEMMGINLCVAQEGDFRKKDPHRSFPFADRYFEEIKALSPEMRALLAADHERLLEWMK